MTDDDENLRGIRAFFRHTLQREKVEVLPYHTLGIYKWETLGIPYTLKDVEPPTAESVKRAEEILESQEISFSNQMPLIPVSVKLSCKHRL